MYSADNVVLTASHTHGSAGGFMQYFLYHITSWGFVKQTFDALLEGVMEVSRPPGEHADAVSYVHHHSPAAADAVLTRCRLTPLRKLAVQQQQQQQLDHAAADRCI